MKERIPIRHHERHSKLEPRADLLETDACPMNTKELVAILERDGPLTGAELLAQAHMEPLPLWRL